MESQTTPVDITVIVTAMTDPEERWLGIALESVLNQTVLPNRIIVMICEDNQWADQVIGSLLEKGKETSRVGFHRIPMALLGEVRNRGVELAETTWVAFLDGDDIWMPDKLEKQLGAVRHDNVDFVGTDFVFITSDGKRFGYSNGSTPTPSSWMVRTECMKRFPFDPTHRIGEDHFWLIKTRPYLTRVRIPSVLVGYRIRSGSISAAKANSTLRYMRELAARFSEFIPVRLVILSVTYIRYLLHRNRNYEV